MRSVIFRYVLVLGAAFGSSLLVCSFLSLYLLNVVIHFTVVCFGVLFVLGFLNVGRAIVKRKDVESGRAASIRRTLLINLVLLFFIGFQLPGQGFIICAKARTHVNNVLANLDIDEIVVRVEGKEITDKRGFFEAIKGMQYISSHHSHAIEEVECEIVYPENTLNLVIGRDSGVKNQYWIFYPKYRFTRLNWIGGFYSDSIDLKNL